MKRFFTRSVRSSFFIASLFIASFFIFSSVPAFAASAEKSTIAQATERGILRVGFSSFVPWAMQDKTGAFIGFEIDVATRLAKDLGLKLQLSPTNWAGIIPALLSKKFDVIIGSMGITPERSLQVNFTIPYDVSRIEIAANKEKTTNLKNIEDFNNEKVIITCRMGTTAAIIAKQVFPKATFRMFADEAPCVEEVLSGRAHAFISSAPLPTFETLKSPDKLVQPFEIKGFEIPVAFAVNKGDIDTLNVFDSWIRAVEAEGWLQDRRHYWFKTMDWEEK